MDRKKPRPVSTDRLELIINCNTASSAYIDLFFCQFKPVQSYIYNNVIGIHRLPVNDPFQNVLVTLYYRKTRRLSKSRYLHNGTLQNHISWNGFKLIVIFSYFCKFVTIWAHKFFYVCFTYLVYTYTNVVKFKFVVLNVRLEIGRTSSSCAWLDRHFVFFNLIIIKQHVYNHSLISFAVTTARKPLSVLDPKV